MIRDQYETLITGLTCLAVGMVMGAAAVSIHMWLLGATLYTIAAVLIVTLVRFAGRGEERKEK